MSNSRILSKVPSDLANTANGTLLSVENGEIVWQQNYAWDAANTSNLNAANASFLTTGTVPNARLSNIPNSSLANSSITINGTGISLGGSGTVTANAATLTGTNLNSTVTGSSLTSVGTLSSLSVSGTTSLANVSYTGTLTGGTGILNIGSGQIYKDANGNIGIGTSSPQALLSIGSGSAVASNPTYGGSVLIASQMNSLSSVGGVEFRSVNFASGYGHRISSPDLSGGNTPLVFERRTNSVSWSESLRVTSSGDVLITGGGGQLISERFQVKGTTLGGNSGDKAYNTSFYTPDTSNTTRINILDYRYTSGTSHTSSRNLIQRRVDSTDMGYIGFDSSATSIGWGTTEHFRIDSSGNVGIGTNNPSLYGRLAVNGNIVLVGSGLLDFTATTVPTISKSSTNRLDISPIGGPHSSNPFWTGLHLSSPLVTEGGTNRFPRASHYYSYTTETNPTDLTYNILAGNGGGLNHNIYIGTQLGKVDLGTNSLSRLSVNNIGNILMGQESIDTLRYFDIQNVSSGNNAGAIIRLIHMNSPGNTVTSVDFVKYSKNGLFLNNNDGSTTNFTAFAVGGVECIRMIPAGNVGIGTNNPGSGTSFARLHVFASGQNDNNGIILAESAFSSSSVCARSSTGTTQLFQWVNNGSRIGSRIANAGNAGNLYLTTGADAVSFTVFSGTGNATLQGVLTQNSDVRIKGDIHPLKNCLDKTLALNPVSYRKKLFDRDSKGNIIKEVLGDRKYLGFVAQEVFEVIPEVVTGDIDSQDPERGLGIEYQNMVAVLVGAIKELHTEIESLKQKIN